ncbi:MAG: hypothetical protein WCH85_10000 [Methanomicrobiales archaeon]
MRTICFYISDYGYGHATRSIALIRKILSHYPDCRIIVKSEGPFDLLSKSLQDPRISVIRSRNDITIPLLSTGAVDGEKTRILLTEWQESWSDYVAREVQFCKELGVDLILSDIAPQPFLVAEDLGIPSVAISNFSWDTIYQHIVPAMTEFIDDIRSAYSCATLACVLPFQLPMNAFRKTVTVSLLSREVTVPRNLMREQRGLDEDDIVVFFNPRCRVDPPGPEIYKKLSEEKIRLIMPSASAARHPQIISIPSSETESQNWIGMCDLVVTRCGYSTVSEAVKAKVPLVVWERPGFIEDTAIAADIERLGVGRSQDYNEIRSLDWIAELPGLSRYKQHYVQIAPNYSNSGSNDILSCLKEYIA